jgi:hypothetical protein
MPIANVSRAHREDNRLRPEDRSAHDWYRFVLAFPPHLVREYIARFGLNHTHRVLDPFAGTGTTLVECKKLGIPSIGIEANPVPSLAAQVKTDWDIDPDELSGHAAQVAELASQRLEARGFADCDDLPLFASGRSRSELKTLPQETQRLLLKGSISPVPLHKTLVLMEVLDELKDEHFYRHERLALARTIVFGASNLQFGPEVGVGPPKADAPVVRVWLSAVLGMATDLRRLGELAGTPVAVHQGDSRQPQLILDSNLVDAVITSPPYPNEKDYTRTTRLESVLLGFIRSKDDLRALKQSLLRSNTRGVYQGDDDDHLVAGHPEISRIAEAIEARRIELGKTSGFERMYARVTRLYFGGMARHLAELRAVLRPGARLAYVVGDQASYLQVMIRTGQLLADIAVTLGYEVLGIDLYRTRLATQTREQLREEVVVLRWPGGVRRA